VELTFSGESLIRILFSSIHKSTKRKSFVALLYNSARCAVSVEYLTYRVVDNSLVLFYHGEVGLDLE